MPSVCELKIMLKKAGIKGYTNLKKVELERLLDTGTPSSSLSKTPRTPRTPRTPKGDSVEKKPRKPRVAKPKAFVPAEVKGATPVVAEPQIPKIIYPNKPPVLKPSKKSAMDKFFGGVNLIKNQLPSPRGLPAPSLMLNMMKVREQRKAQEAPFASPRIDIPPSERGKARVGEIKQYV